MFSSSLVKISTLIKGKAKNRAGAPLSPGASPPSPLPPRAGTAALLVGRGAGASRLLSVLSGPQASLSMGHLAALKKSLRVALAT